MLKMKPGCPLAADEFMKLKITNIVDRTGAVVNDAGRLEMTVQLTTIDPTSGAVTVLPLTGAVPVHLVNGSGGVITSLGVLLTESGFSEIPNGTSVEILDVAIRDPNGDRFAVPGVFLP
jgi:hypothetical protein